jgi:hypothetical protein
VVVEHQEDFHRGMSDALVAINECMIGDEIAELGRREVLAFDRCREAAGTIDDRRLQRMRD